VVLSIIIPVYNEENTVLELLSRVKNVKLPGIKKELIVINDGSTDGTKNILIKQNNTGIKILNKSKNEGKGAAIRDGIKKATGDIVIIQDADLEYDPDEYGLLIAPILDNKADVVFGSRFTISKPHRVLYYWHSVGNKLLTTLCNMITNLNLSDMETCYKAFTKEVASHISIEQKRFGFEPEFTIKVAKMGYRIYEVGISYSGRNYSEGKKINWKDGFQALWCIFKYGFTS
jgi:glycosyltransferase involved in cell wall biosynthesis